MAVTFRNILVGAANLYIADQGVDPPEFDDTETFEQALEASEDWEHVGGTQEGVELTYEPDYGEVEVDQVKDAAKLFNQGVTVQLNTTLIEGTLENLLVAWGIEDAALYDDGRFRLGVPGDDPVERSAIVVGKAPEALDDDEWVRSERLYLARRVLSVEGSSFSMRRTEATTFPVTFRLLPDPAFVKSEYGEIVDRIRPDDAEAATDSNIVINEAP